MKRFVFFILLLLLFHSGFAQLQPFQDAAGKYGFKNLKGEIIVAPQFDKAFPEWNYFAAVNKGYKEITENGKTKLISCGNWGFINSKGQLVIPHQYDMVMPATSNGLFIVNTGAKPGINGKPSGGKWAIVDVTNKINMPAKYEMIVPAPGNKWMVNTGGKFEFSANEGIADPARKGKWSLLNTDGSEAVKPLYSNMSVSEGVGLLVTEAVTGKSGIISLEGKIRIPCIYDSVFSFHEQAALAVKNGKYGFINTENQVLIPFEYDHIGTKNLYANAYFPVTKNGQKLEINAAGKPAPVSPEGPESVFQKALAAAPNSRERANAVHHYLNKLHEQNYTKEDKIYLLGQKFKQAVEIDFFCVFESVMTYKNENNNSVIYQAAIKSLTPEQITAFKQAAQFRVDEFVASQNGKPAPAWPAGVPKPGYGWGKTISSDKPVYTATAATSGTNLTTPSRPEVTEAQVKAVVGNVYRSWSKAYRSEYIIKITGYSKNSYGNGFQLETKQVHEYTYHNDRFHQCNVERQTMNAEDFFYNTSGVNYSLIDPYEVCKSCNGTGYVTQNFSHTNDYQYTLGKKVTYTSSQQVRCTACSNNAYRLKKPIVLCVESGY